MKPAGKIAVGAGGLAALALMIYLATRKPAPPPGPEPGVEVGLTWD